MLVHSRMILNLASLTALWKFTMDQMVKLTRTEMTRFILCLNTYIELNINGINTENKNNRRSSTTKYTKLLDTEVSAGMARAPQATRAYLWDKKLKRKYDFLAVPQLNARVQCSYIGYSFRRHKQCEMRRHSSQTGRADSALIHSERQNANANTNQTLLPSRSVSS